MGNIKLPIRSPKLMIALVGTLFLCACDVVSLAPLYDENTLVVVPELSGSWKVDATETWTITPASKKMYDLVIKEVLPAEPGKAPQTSEEKLSVGLVQLSGKLFMDLQSEDSGATGAPAHKFARIEVDQDVLHVGWVDDSWMENMLKQNPYLTWVKAAHDKTVLTAPTKDLQLFFREHAWDEQAYLKGKRDGPDDSNTFLQRIR